MSRVCLRFRANVSCSQWRKKQTVNFTFKFRNTVCDRCYSSAANYWWTCSHGACQIEQSRSRHSSDLSPGVSVAGTDGQEMLEWSWSRPSQLSVSPSASSLAPAQTQPDVLLVSQWRAPTPSWPPRQDLTWLSSFNLYLYREASLRKHPVYEKAEAKKRRLPLSWKPSSVWQDIFGGNCRSVVEGGVHDFKK